MKPQNNYFNSCSCVYIFYIINQISIIIIHPIRLVVLIFIIKYYLHVTEVLEQQGVGRHALNIVAIRVKRHANVRNVRKQKTLLADVDVAPSHGTT